MSSAWLVVVRGDFYVNSFSLDRYGELVNARRFHADIHRKLRRELLFFRLSGLVWGGEVISSLDGDMNGYGAKEKRPV